MVKCLTTRGRKLESWELATLSSLLIDSYTVRIPSQLPPARFQQLKAVLVAIGGKWVGNKIQGFVFPKNAISPRELLDQVLATGLAPSERALDFFPTPSALIRDILEIEQVAQQLFSMSHALEERCAYMDPYLLEPSAGRGAFIEAISAKYLSLGGRWHVVEQNTSHIPVLEALQAGPVIHSDFLAWTPDHDRKFEFIAMNPPFTSETDPYAFIEHVKAAHSLLESTGLLVAIVPTQILTAPLLPQGSVEQRLLAFRNFVLQHGEWYINHARAFAESGTLTPTLMIVLRAAQPSVEHDGWTNFETWHTSLICENNSGYRERYQLLLARYSATESSQERELILKDHDALVIKAAYDNDNATHLLVFSELRAHFCDLAEELRRQKITYSCQEFLALEEEAVQAERLEAIDQQEKRIALLHGSRLGIPEKRKRRSS